VLGAWWLGSVRFVKAVGITATLLAVGTTFWLVGATSVCIRLPGGHIYPVHAADDFCTNDRERAARLRQHGLDGALTHSRLPWLMEHMIEHPRPR
jgi:hypothetical protein